MARLGPREFAVQLWDGEQWPRELGGSADFKLIFRIPNVVRSMFSNINSLSFGEAYIYGHLDVEGSLIDVFESGDRLLTIHYPASEKLRLPRWLWSIPAVKYPGNGTFGGFARRNTSTAAHIRAAVNYHYDHPVDFWKLWLDESLSYSCAYFDSPEIYSRQLKRTISIISAESCVSRPGSGCSIWDVAGDQTEARSQRSPAHARGLVSSGAGRVKPRLNRLNRDKSAPRSCSSGSGPAATAANFWNRARVTDCAIQMQSHPGRVNGPSCRVPLIERSARSRLAAVRRDQVPAVTLVLRDPS